jgi:hypothetical protein
MQGSSQRASFEVTKNGVGSKQGAGSNRLAPGVAAKENAPSKQGSSKEAGWESLGAEGAGEAASSKMKETDHKPLGKGAGPAKDFKTVEDPTKEINKSSSRGNVMRGEAVVALFDGQELTEEFKSKVAGLFEALVDAAVAEQREEIENEAAQVAVEHIMGVEQQLTEQVDKYLDYIAEQWIEKNEVTVDNALKTELAESFFAGLRELFENHYVTIPEGGTDVVDELTARVTTLEAELNATVEAGLDVTEEVLSLRKNAVLAEASEGLVLTDAERLATLCEDVAFEDDASFLEKVKVIRESYFKKEGAGAKVLKEEKGTELEEVKGEDNEKVETEVTDPTMLKYVSAIAQNARL